MTSFRGVVATIEALNAEDLRHWVDEGWVRPVKRGRAMTFSGVDLARVLLICDIRYNLMIDEDALPLVLSLLDQIYSLRRELSAVKEALDSQPQSVRERSAGSSWRAPSEAARGAGGLRARRSPPSPHRQAAS